MFGHCSGMRTLLTSIALLPLLLAGPAQAQDLLKPLDDLVDQFTAPPDEEEAAPVPRPRPPDVPVVPGVAAPAEEKEVAVEDGDRVYQAACPAVVMGLVEAEMAPPLSDGVCGERSPLVVTAVLSHGRMVPLSAPVTTNCQLATQLPEWLETVDGYAEAALGSRLATVETGTSYMCRATRGGAADRLSEHSFANAVDVVGFTLEDGQRVAVESGWPDAGAPAGRLLRLAHDAACSGFMTVLGPEANAEHADHLHLDMGCHGESCAARICE
ncbi:MAG TPA: extensin family protein [Devosia sp.]|uniref:extensin-like domain-containing protein n=1 Tax=Devosia sp. TaxID=1871048 RepID=UPI002F930DD5